MARSVLITQCIQRDFVDPVRPYDPLPNRLHVGHAEAERLLGLDPSAGPLMQLMRWARQQAPEDLSIIHIRDWHDPADPRQQAHLRRFGPHCLRGTRGAAFAFDAEDAASRAPNEHIVNAIDLNDFEGTNLERTLSGIAMGEPLRVAVIGVWTEAKISFLLYDLKTRLGIDDLATCSALTASNSRAQHFIALDQLHKLLGVEICDSVAGFVDWLTPGARLDAALLPARIGPALELDAGLELSADDRAIVDHLYRDSAAVSLKPLAGGFSGAAVYRTNSVDALGQRQASTVLKLGPARLVGGERAAFERVQEVLGNHAPVVRGFVDVGARAGIKYAYAAMGEGGVRTLKSMVEDGAPVDAIIAVIDEVFSDVLEPFYAAARYERLALFPYYGYRAFWAGVRPRVEEVLGGPADGETLLAPDGSARLNVVRFYEELLHATPDQPGEAHYVSSAHGDLNGANILLDGRDNVWVIDFAHTSPDHHVLRDVAKLENDLLYIMTPLDSEDELVEALKLTDALRQVVDLAAPLPETVPGLRSPALTRAWALVRALRRHAGRLVREDRHPLQLDVALLRYAIHTLSFDESGPLQKRWALANACGLAGDIAATLQADRALRVDWVEADALGLPGALGLTLCPGRRDRGRRATEDAAQLAAMGVRHLLCLIGDDELAEVDALDLPNAARAAGISWRQMPILDQGVPTVDEARALVMELLTALSAGERVVVHCMGGLGRTGTICAATLIERGLTTDEALASVRRSRGPRCVENSAQEAFLRRYETAARP